MPHNLDTKNDRLKIRGNVFLNLHFFSKTRFHEQYIICTQGIISTVEASLPPSSRLLVTPLRSKYKKEVVVVARGSFVCLYYPEHILIFPYFHNSDNAIYDALWGV